MTTVPFLEKSSAVGALRRLTGVSATTPLSAMIEIADRCNEVCVHCYQIQGQKGELSTTDWRGVMDELAKMGILFLTVSGGEATLRPDFLELVAHARDLKFAVKIFTNGLNMDEALADELARLAVQEVQISLYSPRAEVHDWVTRVPGSFDKVINATELLVERGVAVVVKTMLTTFNVQERDAYVALAERLGADYKFDGQLDPREDGDRGPQSFSVSREQWLEIHRDPTLHRAPVNAHAKDLDAGVCFACAGSIQVEPNGDLHPCTQLGDRLGNAVEDGIKSSWLSRKAQTIRNLTWRDIHGCRDCELVDYCNRCFSNAQKEAGDALGPYVSACARAQNRYELIEGVRPSVLAADGRDGSLGPYRVLSGHRIEPIEDRRTAADDTLAQGLGWAGQPPASLPTPVGPGGLVQIRRPGAKKSREEAVPRAASTRPHTPEAIDPFPAGRHTVSG